MREKNNSFWYLKKYKNSELLKDDEVKLLEKNGCWAEDWRQVHVKHPIDLTLIHDTGFYGTVYIGHLEKGSILFHGVDHPVGIYGCQIISSCIDDNSSLSMSKVSGSIIGKNVIIQSCGEISSMPDAFKTPVVIGAGNEKAGREAVLFSGINMTDIWLQTHLKDHELFQQFLSEFTE